MGSPWCQTLFFCFELKFSCVVSLVWGWPGSPQAVLLCLQAHLLSPPPPFFVFVFVFTWVNLHKSSLTSKNFADAAQQTCVTSCHYLSAKPSLPWTMNLRVWSPGLGEWVEVESFPFHRKKPRDCIEGFLMGFEKVTKWLEGTWALGKLHLLHYATRWWATQRPGQQGLPCHSCLKSQVTSLKMEKVLRCASYMCCLSWLCSSFKY